MGIQAIATILNEGTDGLFGVCLLFIIWLIVYMRRRNVTPTREAIVGASWATLILSFPMRYLNLLNDWTFGVVIVLALGSIVMLINRE